MPSRSRSPLAVLAIVVLVLAVLREIQIRRHADDLDDWPRQND